MKQSVKDYLKAIENDQDLYEELSPFDEIEGDKEGSLVKGFVRVRGKHLLELYDYMKNNSDCHYKFCGKELVDALDRDTFSTIPYSAMVRKSRSGPEFNRSELIGSRIAEAFGVDCPYVTSFKDDMSIVASMDFLERDQKMETYKEYTGIEYGRNDLASSWARTLKRKIVNEDNLSEQQKFQLIKNIIKHYIVRKFILVDNDFNCGNVAIVKDSKDYINLVSFDFEFCLNNSTFVSRYKQTPFNFVESNIEDLANDFPNELQVVIQELQLTNERTSKIKSILNDYFDDENAASSWNDYIERTISTLTYFSNKYLPEKSM